MSSRLVPFLTAVGVGVVSGMYIWNIPLQQATGRLPPPGPNLPDPVGPEGGDAAKGAAGVAAPVQGRVAEADKKAAAPSSVTETQ